MIEINFKTEIQKCNPVERTCMVMLYGIAIKEGVEIGRFVLEKKLLSGKEYDIYVNQANQSVDEKFLKEWENEIINPLKDGLKQFEKDSNVAIGK